VTFLFTDIEGSSQLWNQHLDAMPHVMARHDALIEATVQQHSGGIVRPRGEGDSRFTVFSSAINAVTCAAALLECLRKEDWSLSEPLQVRQARHWVRSMGPRTDRVRHWNKTS
jgi:class 3 adenylate cyclase